VDFFPAPGCSSEFKNAVLNAADNPNKTNAVMTEKENGAAMKHAPAEVLNSK
jgi:hypothetical protein